ncbi:cell wall hydrolase [Caldalkalibacillus mannanilyticus]|uniref:cell wall hydrolase n=1 Tax=Caldalkalibacillus mannanilyticus TaxID=1418 RepID=UPI00046A5C26|nr:cell wall hydrolase [Caldalkalibacillus mannanilyticus]
MKKLHFTILGIVLLLCIASSQSVLAMEDLDYETYTIQAGDTLWKISREFKIDLNELINYNQLDHHNLQIGEEIKIPLYTYNRSHYVVTQGDTLWTIAQRYQVSITHIKEENSLDRSLLQIGQILRIPPKTDELEKSDKHDKHNKPEATNPLHEHRVFYYIVHGMDNSYYLSLEPTENYVSIDLNTKGKLKAASTRIEEHDETIHSTSENHRQMSYTKEDLKWLATIIEAEAEDQSYLGKLAVGSVVINRLNSKAFPNTVKEVIFQKNKRVYQFSPVGDGRFNRVKPSEDSYRAAKEAFEGEDPTNGAIFFYNPRIAKSKWITTREVAVVIGDHRFAY